MSRTWTGKPNLKGGWLKISREYWLALAQAPMTEAERRLLDTIIALVYGTQPPSPDSDVYATAAELIELTGQERRTFERARQSLHERRMLYYQRSTGQRNPDRYIILDRYQNWTPPVSLEKTALSATSVSHSSSRQYDRRVAFKPAEYDANVALSTTPVTHSLRVLIQEREEAAKHGATEPLTAIEIELLEIDRKAGEQIDRAEALRLRQPINTDPALSPVTDRDPTGHGSAGSPPEPAYPDSQPSDQPSTQTKTGTR